MVLEKTLESPLDCKEIQPVNPKGKQSWIIIEKTDAKAETPILWPPDVNDWLEKTLMLGKIEGRRRRGQQRMRWLDASLTRWTWVWASSKSWWWSGKPGVLQSTGSQSRTRLSYWRLVSGALSALFCCPCQKLSLALFHCHKTFAIGSSECLKHRL